MNTYLLDSNIIIYAINSDSPFHPECNSFVTRAMKGRIKGFICEKSIYEVYAILDDSRRIDKPLSIIQIIDVLNKIINSKIQVLYSDSNTTEEVLRLCKANDIKRQDIFDMVIASQAINNGINKIVTYNKKDFMKIKEIDIITPDMNDL
jgi:predicted nucleic acid-binding protein